MLAGGLVVAVAGSLGSGVLPQRHPSPCWFGSRRAAAKAPAKAPAMADPAPQRNFEIVPYQSQWRITATLDKDGKFDPYAALGVPFLASKDQVKEAYKLLCKREHPDLCGGHSSLRWCFGSKAYRILTNPRTRVNYDMKRGASNIFSFTGVALKLAAAVAASVIELAADAATVLSDVMADPRWFRLGTGFRARVFKLVQQEEGAAAAAMVAAEEEAFTRVREKIEKEAKAKKGAGDFKPIDVSKKRVVYEKEAVPEEVYL